MMRSACLALLLALAALPAAAQDFPQTFEHRFGTTTLEEKPERVVSIDFSGHDNLLALGVTPVALRYWFGADEGGVWPWAQDELGDAEPVVLRGELNIEKIAALDPDVIIGIASGITEEQYRLLSRIAPTIAPQAKYSDYGTPWQLRARIAGRATGHLEEAEAQIDAIETRMAEAAEAHPSWQGQSAAVAFYWDGAPGAYRSIDVRARILGELGFETPAEIDGAAAEDAFYATFSPENLAPLDTDLLIWVVSGDALAEVRDMPLRTSLRAHVEGREVFADEMLSSAFSHATLLSMPYVLDHLIPLIEAAADGDPATPVESSVEAGLIEAP